MDNDRPSRSYEEQREHWRAECANNPEVLAWGLARIDWEEHMETNAPPLMACPQWCDALARYPESHGRWDYDNANQYLRTHCFEVVEGVWVEARERYLDGAHLLEPVSIGHALGDGDMTADEARELGHALLAAADKLDEINGVTQRHTGGESWTA